MCTVFPGVEWRAFIDDMKDRRLSRFVGAIPGLTEAVDVEASRASWD
ncbi:hypothetical protein [Sphaerisporangium aureirubrum]|uniref:DUF397 domain-containing protein n=1 Tax=Sphaerisporangium aureirubrum TaxID=1544736 RepID=A0ABW1NF22_9ACTN